MTDIVHYKIPFWFWVILRIRFLKKQLKNFDYRFKAVEEKFGKW